MSLILDDKKRRDFLEQLCTHGRALAVELGGEHVRTDVLVTHLHDVPRRGPLNRLLGRTRPGFTSVNGWEMGHDSSSALQSLALGTDGMIYVTGRPLVTDRDAVPLNETHITTLESAQAVRECLHALEKRTDIFNKLRNRAE